MANWNLYDNFRLGNFEGGSINFETPGGNGLKIMLVASGYVPNQNTHVFKTSVTNEVTGTGYTAGGNVCANGIAAVDGSGNVSVDADDPATWAQNAGGFSTARRAIMYHDTGTAATSRLIAYSDDFGADKGNVDGDFSITLTTAIFTSAR